MRSPLLSWGNQGRRHRDQVPEVRLYRKNIQETEKKLDFTPQPAFECLKLRAIRSPNICRSRIPAGIEADLAALGKGLEAYEARCPEKISGAGLLCFGVGLRMKIKTVYKILPAVVIFTNRVPEGSAGVANAMIVRIRPEYVNDEGLLQHELTHVKQSYRLLILFHSILYLLDDPYRLHAEVEAYRKQLEYSKNKVADIDRFAGFIAEKYDLDISRDAAAMLLRA